MQKYTEEEVNEIERASWYIRSALSRAIDNTLRDLERFLDNDDKDIENISGLISHQLQWVQETIHHARCLPEDMCPEIKGYDDAYILCYDKFAETMRRVRSSR